MGIIHIEKIKLLELLEKAFDEGNTGYRDLKEETINSILDRYLEDNPVKKEVKKEEFVDERQNIINWDKFLAKDIYSTTSATNSYYIADNTSNSVHPKEYFVTNSGI